MLYIVLPPLLPVPLVVEKMTRKSNGTMQLPFSLTTFAQTLIGSPSSPWYVASVSSTWTPAMTINCMICSDATIPPPHSLDVGIMLYEHGFIMLILLYNLLSSSVIVMVVNCWPIVMSLSRPFLKRLMSKLSSDSSWLESTIPIMKQLFLVQASIWIVPLASSVT